MSIPSKEALFVALANAIVPYLKEKSKDIKIFLSDPTGSALYNYIKNGELKSDGGSITEGIGSSRITKNFEDAKIDDAFRDLSRIRAYQ